MAQMLGYSDAEMHARAILEFMDADGRQIASEALETLRRGTGHQSQMRFRRKDGTRVSVFVSANPLPSADGTYRGGLAMVTEIIERAE
jgi:PAS domain S-box-containing protein